jgi:hypothetical protein
MGLFDFFRKGRKKKAEAKKDQENLSSGSNRYIELDEFLYLSVKMIINSQVSSNNEHIGAFIKNQLSDQDNKRLQEEIKYFMFCLLNFHIYSEVVVNKKIIDLSTEKAQKHFINLTNSALDRAFLTAFSEIEFSVDKYEDRYEKYSFYLERYKYSNFERSFVECFAMILSGAFDDEPIDIEDLELLQLGKWIYTGFGESTRITVRSQNFIL